MKHIGQIITSHNKKILATKTEPEKPCNCKKTECPLLNKKHSCRTENVVYKAVVKSPKEIRSYIGLTSLEFKQRFYKHRSDFKHKKQKDSTRLSKYIWNLKDNNIEYSIDWSILRKTKKTNNGDKICSLCIMEAKLIMENKQGPLNKRTEIMSKCRHRNKFLLKNWKKKKDHQQN